MLDSISAIGVTLMNVMAFGLVLPWLFFLAMPLIAFCLAVSGSVLGLWHVNSAPSEKDVSGSETFRNLRVAKLESLNARPAFLRAASGSPGSDLIGAPNGWGAPQQHTPIFDSNQNFNVMMVDDSPESVELLKRSLVGYGCHTQVIDKPREAVRKMNSSRDADLLVLDWSMPGMGGGATLVNLDRKLKKIEEPNGGPHKRIPVVVYSGLDQTQIEFPSTHHFFNVGHLSKATPLKDLSSKMHQILTTLRQGCEAKLIRGAVVR